MPGRFWCRTCRPSGSTRTLPVAPISGRIRRLDAADAMANERVKTRRRRCQFTLRSLLLVVLVFSLMMSWVAVRMERGRRQKEAVERIAGLGGVIGYDYQVEDYFAFATVDGELVMPIMDFKAQPPGPRWLRDLLGIHTLTSVKYIVLAGEQIDNDKMTPLGDLKSCEYIQLHDTRVTPEGVKKLEAALPECALVVNGRPIGCSRN